MEDAERERLKRIEEKLDELLAIAKEELEEDEPDPIAEAFVRMRQQRRGRAG